MLERSQLTPKTPETMENRSSTSSDKLAYYAAEKLPAATFSGTKEQMQMQMHLPNLILSKEEFAPVALSIFNRLDFNHDGNLDKNELKNALDNPSTFDTSKTRQAIKIMYDQYQFLTDISPRAIDPFKDKGPVITREGLQKIDDICAGRIDPDKEILSSTNRTDYSRGFGIGGSLAYLPGSFIGTCMSFGMAYRLGLGAAARYALGTAGFFTGLVGPALVGGAIGYGVGYILDKYHKETTQKAEVASFMGEFDRPAA